MDQSRPGQVVTFYSFPGGTGRTMATANVGWILAAAGKKVLIVDWDLEAPGVVRFLVPFLDVASVAQRFGLIDLLREYESQILDDPANTQAMVSVLAAVERHATPVEWYFGKGGELSVLPVGRQNRSYSPALGDLGWSRFFDQLNGAEFLEALRDNLRAHFDYTLIDSPSGASDVADMCTHHLPDVVVLGYSLTNQAIEGAVETAHSVATFARRVEPDRTIRILPVPMRVETSLSNRAEAGRRLAERAFVGLPAGMADADRAGYFASVEIPYRGAYAFEETLATFADKPGDPASLLAAYERLTDVITSGEVSSIPGMRDDERRRVLREFRRDQPRRP